MIYWFSRLLTKKMLIQKSFDYWILKRTLKCTYFYLSFVIYFHKKIFIIIIEDLFTFS